MFHIKALMKSWTVWFNVLLILTEAVNQLSGVLALPPGWVLQVAALGNLLLRIKTYMQAMDKAMPDDRIPAAGLTSAPNIVFPKNDLP